MSSTEQQSEATGVATPSETLTVTDNRTGRTYELPITDDTVKAMDLRQIKVNDDDFGMMAYDPAFTNTASCRSAVTYIDGAAGSSNTVVTRSSSSASALRSSRPPTC